MAEQIIEFEAMEQAVSLFGSFDENVKLIENEYDVSIISRGSELKVMGDVENVDKAARALRSMLAMINKGESLTEQNVRYVLTLVNEGNEDKIASMSSGSICISSKGRPIKPKTLGQKRYCDAILNNTITFGIGPAGTGKTYLAIAMAVTAFRAKEVDRIILTRPAVEAGEKLGFLPGDLQSKVDPYLRPLYDALFDNAFRPMWPSVTVSVTAQSRLPAAPLVSVKSLYWQSQELSFLSSSLTAQWLSSSM